MLNFSSLALRRGARLLFEQVSLTIHQGRKVGITGANGCGKSSLFALIRGQLSADQGEFSMPPALVVAHVAQETPALARTAIDYVLDGDVELRQVEAALVQAEAENAGERVALLHGQLENIGGYTARSRAARLLDGLGFRPSQIEAQVADFSGGWRMRLNLAQALMCRSDLLLLDEPTNHLDLDAVIWLQEWLAAYPGTLLLISHDRDFLDEVVDQVLHIEQGRLQLYTGNYSRFELARAEQLAQQQSAYERQQREVAHMRSFVERFRAKATKAKQAQSRLKALERMELIAQAHVDSPFHFSFRIPQKLPRPLLNLDQVACGYGDKVIVERANLCLMPESRLGLLGPNGAGKSTLIKLLAGEMEALAGQTERSSELKVGYFAQHQLEQLRPEESPVQHLQRLDPKASDAELRSYVGGFGFHGDQALAPVAPFSGGEKARLVLALLVYQAPNLLLLDEPTNHLDLEMRQALINALQEYQGALVVVSHDRHLLRSVCDDFLLVEGGRAQPFDDDLEAYRRWLAQRSAEQRRESSNPKGDATTAEHSATARKDRKRLEAERRKQLQPLRKQQDDWEKRLGKLQEEQRTVAAALADAGLYEASGKERLKKLLAQQTELHRAVEEAEGAWMEAMEALDAAERALEA